MFLAYAEPTTPLHLPSSSQNTTLPDFIIENHFHFLPRQQSRTVRECGLPLRDCEQLSYSRNDSSTTTRRESTTSLILLTRTHLYVRNSREKRECDAVLLIDAATTPKNRHSCSITHTVCSRVNNPSITLERQCISVTASCSTVDKPMVRGDKQRMNVTASCFSLAKTTRQNDNEAQLLTRFVYVSTTCSRNVREIHEYDSVWTLGTEKTTHSLKTRLIKRLFCLSVNNL